MKKNIILIIVSLLIGFIVGSIITIFNIQIDAIDEVDYGIVTIKCYGQYIDYYYEK